MTRIAMDPDQVRAMANTANRTAESIQGHMSQLVSAVRGAEWQSQAREDFIERLETLSRVNTQSMSALRLMANAVNQKARQWEAKASRFGSTLEAIGSLWSSFMDNLNNTWQGLLDSISKIGIGGIAIIGGGIGAIGGWIGGILPDWPWKPPDWWPFKQKPTGNVDSGTENDNENTDSPSENDQGENQEVIPKDVNKPAIPIGLDQDDPRWGNEVMGDNGDTIDESGCLITSIAMIARSHGADVTPADVNAYMKTHGGYQEGTSYMYWGSAEKYLESVIGKDFTYKGIVGSDITNTLNSGAPVLLHVKGNTSDGHWVLATGVDSAGNYLVIDSGTGKQSTYSPSQLHEQNNHRAFI